MINQEEMTYVCKARPLGNSQPIEDQCILIGGTLPSIMTLKESEKLYDKHARRIDDALADSLPQGTHDRLGILFMQRKASLYQGRTK